MAACEKTLELARKYLPPFLSGGEMLNWVRTAFEVKPRLTAVLQARSAPLVEKCFSVRYLVSGKREIQRKGIFMGLVELPDSKCYALQFRFEGGSKVREPKIPISSIIELEDLVN